MLVLEDDTSFRVGLLMSALGRIYALHALVLVVVGHGAIHVRP